jgi:hypothetical protein
MAGSSRAGHFSLRKPFYDWQSNRQNKDGILNEVKDLSG